MAAVRTVLQALLVAAVAAAAQAAPPAPVQAEIDALLDALQRSGCEFQRNGNWHSGGEARVHLQSKREWLERRGAIRSTEDFIAQAASQSSMSGRPYQVRCAGSGPQDSSPWLQQRLREIRGARPAPG